MQGSFFKFERNILISVPVIPYTTDTREYQLNTDALDLANGAVSSRKGNSVL